MDSGSDFEKFEVSSNFINDYDCEIINFDEEQEDVDTSCHLFDEMLVRAAACHLFDEMLVRAADVYSFNDGNNEPLYDIYSEQREGEGSITEFTLLENCGENNIKVSADKLEKDLVQMVVKDSVDSDDGEKTIICETPLMNFQLSKQDGNFDGYGNSSQDESRGSQGGTMLGDNTQKYKRRVNNSSQGPASMRTGTPVMKNSLGLKDQKEYIEVENKYEEALKIKPNFYEALKIKSNFYEARGQQKFEQTKLSWYYAIGTDVDLESWPSTEVLQLYNNVEENMLMWEDTEDLLFIVDVFDIENEEFVDIVLEEIPPGLPPEKIDIDEK